MLGFLALEQSKKSEKMYLGIALWKKNSLPYVANELGTWQKI